jgi:hypothetical protein
LTGASALFDLVQDPAETTDVSGGQPEMMRILMGELQRYASNRVAAELRTDLTPQEIHQLKELGYLDDDPPRRDRKPR